MTEAPSGDRCDGAMPDGIRLTLAQRDALKQLARRPVDWRRAETTECQQLIDRGLARLERSAGGALAYEITPAGRRALASSAAAFRVRKRRAAEPWPEDEQGPHRAELTIAQMQLAGWVALSRCANCGVTVPVNLDLLAWRFGGKVLLSERRDRCSNGGCHGRLQYLARGPGGTFAPLGERARGL